MNATVRRALGLAAGAAVVVAAIVAFRPSSDIGYVEIKTVPVAPLTQTALYIDATRVGPIKEGSAILQHRVGTLRLQSDGIAGSLAPLCEIVVKRNRVTTVTVSVLERPPRCLCRFNGAEAHACVS